MQLFVKLVPALIQLKDAFWSKGKFIPQRAMLVMGALVICIAGAQLLGVDQMSGVIEMVDDLGDVIGE